LAAQRHIKRFTTMRNRLILIQNGSVRVTSHQAVTRLVIKLRLRKRFFVDLRKVGGWHVTDLEKQLVVW
jgi:hypothetical protein